MGSYAHSWEVCRKGGVASSPSGLTGVALYGMVVVGLCAVREGGERGKLENREGERERGGEKGREGVRRGGREGGKGGEGGRCVGREECEERREEVGQREENRKEMRYTACHFPQSLPSLWCRTRAHSDVCIFHGDANTSRPLWLHPPPYARDHQTYRSSVATPHIPRHASCLVTWIMFNGDNDLVRLV